MSVGCESDALSEMSGSEALQGVATLFKRAKNITKGAAAESLAAGTPLRAALTEPSELALVDALDAKASAIHGASARGASTATAAAASIAATEMCPGRISTGCSPRASIMVDSMPMSLAPPSST